jgi:hypothetical protein
MQTSLSPISVIEVLIAVVVFIMVTWNLWVTFINTVYLRSIPWIVLEIVPPRDVYKSPLAMELVLNVLHGGGAGNWYEKYWKGELAQYYSLEIASIEGKIHFYVRFHKKFQKAFEAQLYAQYPQAVVREVEDYVARVPDFKKGGPINLFAYSLELSKDDPYPIKSYIDFGLDRAIGSLEENERIDPITPLLETMGSIGIGEQIWVQILLRADTKRFTVKNDKGIVETGKSWKDKSREIIRDLRSKLALKDAEGKTLNTDRPTKGEQAVIEAIERHRNKPGFDCGMRVIYLADKDKFSGNSITAFTTMFRQFNSDDMNSFKMTGLTRFVEPWKDPLGTRIVKMKKDYLDAYKNRWFFFGGFDPKKPYKSLISHPAVSGGKPFIFSTEELATIFHLPGRVVETPTFLRIESTKAEPPANLPI